MATLQDAINKLRNLADDLDDEIPNLLLELEVTAKSLVQDRVQEEGKDSKGQQIGDYSKKKIPAFFYLGKGKKATDQKIKKAIKEKKKLSYSDFRALDGKQNRFVDLTFTGQMFRDIGVVEKSDNKKTSTVIIAPKTERSEKVADYNTKRYGNFLEPSEEELELLGEDLAADVEVLINKGLNGL